MGSRREGLEETLTVLKLGLPPTLRRFFATTNCIENLMGTLRHVSRNVKRWRPGDMRQRWLGLGLLRAAERFRRIKAHGDLGALATALGEVQRAPRHPLHWRKGPHELRPGAIATGACKQRGPVSTTRPARVSRPKAWFMQSLTKGRAPRNL